MKHKNELPPIPEEAAPQIPEGLSRLILKCLEKDKAKRYQTAEELLADVAAVEESLPTTERVATKRKTITHREVTVKFQPRKLAFPAVAVIVLAVAGFFLWRNVIHRPAPPLPSAKPTLAIFNFENISKDPGLDLWKQGLRVLLASGLGQSQYLKVLDEASVLGILRKLGLSRTEKFTADDLKHIAAEGGATHLLTGNYLPTGGKVIVNLSLIDAKTGAPLRPIQDEAPNSDGIPASADSLVKKVKSALDISEPAIDERFYKMVGEVYTRNPKALQEYFLAVQFRERGEWDKSVEAFEKAVAIDPEFAIAHRSLAGMLFNRFEFVRGYGHYLKAHQLKEKLPEQERLLVEGTWLSLQEKTFPKAHAVYHKLIELYPGNAMGRFSLAFTADDPEESIREYDNLIHVQNDRGLIAYNNLCRLYCSRGEYRKARELWEESLPFFPQQTWRNDALATIYVLEGNTEAARGVYEKMARDGSDFDAKADIANYFFAKEDIDSALEIIEKLRREEKDPSVADGWFIGYDFMKGKIKQALDLGAALENRALSAGEGDISLSQTLIWSGRSFLQTGAAGLALEKFQSALEYVKRQEDKLPEVPLAGLIHHRRIALIWQACALCDLGRLDEAEALYKKIEDLIPERDKKIKKSTGESVPASIPSSSRASSHSREEISRRP